MFSYFSQVKAKGQKILFAALVLVLLTTFMGGCKTDDDFVDDHILNPGLVDTWADPYAGDGYTITSETSGYRLAYIDWLGSEAYAGTIRYVSNFSNNAGVIIIEYEPGKEPSYFTSAHWGTEASGWTDACIDPQPCIHYIPPTGDFVGVYYENFSPGVSVMMATAIDLATYYGAEKTTLDAAIAAFTSGNKGDYIGFMGVYQKQ